MEIEVAVNLDARSIVTNLTRSQLLSFIKKLDAETEEWDTAVSLYNHFNKLYKDWLVEHVTDLLLSDYLELDISIEDAIFAKHLLDQ